MLNAVLEILGSEDYKGTFPGMYDKKYRKLIKRLSIKYRKSLFFVEDIHWRILIRLLLGNVLIHNHENGKSMLVRDIEKEIEKMLSLIKDNIRWRDIDVPHYKSDIPGLYLTEFEENYVDKIFRNKKKYSEMYYEAILRDSLINADYELSPDELKLVEAEILSRLTFKDKVRWATEELEWFRDEWVPELLSKCV